MWYQKYCQMNHGTISFWYISLVKNSARYQHQQQRSFFLMHIKNLYILNLTDKSKYYITFFFKHTWTFTLIYMEFLCFYAHVKKYSLIVIFFFLFSSSKILHVYSWQFWFVSTTTEAVTSNNIYKPDCST